ncbi:formylglycine-generating enzyme family protein [Leptothoe spongobia TAU-MAC 1115]|uniref:Formylglycine-generating enzyme family protein n=2 Tax=Leptothoe TaxID=2651725 RepID=A0A947DD98_9CYAN|nr:formylglycine-generating enzyme family protein [Leptothoe spongobia TAU-MAC 1115]
MGRGEQVGGELLSRAEMARLAQVTETLREQLADYKELIDYASLVSDVQRSNRQLAAERVEKTYVVAPGKFLRLPSVMQQELRAKNRIRAGESDVVGVTEAVAFGGPQSPVSKSSDVGEARVELPVFQTLKFVTAQIVDVDAEPATPDDSSRPELKQETVTVAEVQLKAVEQLVSELEGPGLETFEFRTGRLEKRERGNFLTRLLPGRQQSIEWVVTRQRRQGSQWVERLTDELTLEMVALPGGTFQMGAPRGETDRQSYEGPQHQVTVPEFWLGKYAVTQAQWRFVVGLPQVNVEMPSDPSKFKGDNRPVEQVSWYEAEEFCARLSVYTGRKYRLPSEAEWEYACRARTKTPFHFGETLTTDIANYNGNATYGDGPKGQYRNNTTSVGHFEVANAFGLYDMHGNVWEWCADHWHKNYDKAPTDGRPWQTEDSEANRVLRGGSWIFNPRDCRSASRDVSQPGDRDDVIGFRVSCEPPGSLQ